MPEANQGAAANLAPAPGASGSQAEPAPTQSVMVVPMSKTTSQSADQVEKGFEMWKRLGLPAEDFIKAAAADGHKVGVGVPRDSRACSSQSVPSPFRASILQNGTSGDEHPRPEARMEAAGSAVGGLEGTAGASTILTMGGLDTRTKLGA